MLRVSRISSEAFGFIGLGKMGARMAPNLFKNAECTELYIFDINPDAARKVVEGCGGRPVKVCSSPAEVAKHCKKIITVLPDCSVVRDVFNNSATGIFSTIREGSIVVDSSPVVPCKEYLPFRRTMQLPGSSLPGLAVPLPVIFPRLSLSSCPLRSQLLTAVLLSTRARV